MDKSFGGAHFRMKKSCSPQTLWSKFVSRQNRVGVNDL